MKDTWSTARSWLEDSTPFAMATVVETWGSAPRGVGSTLLIGRDLQIAGSVSGGCVENAVIEQARQVLDSGRPLLLGYGVSDETAWSVGLTCGGKVQIFLELHPSCSAKENSRLVWRALQTALEEQRPAILLTRLDPDRYSHLLVFADGSQVGDWAYLNQAANSAALQAWGRRQSGKLELEGEEVFAQVLPRHERLIIIGAAHISLPLVALGKQLGFEVLVIDPRRIFSTEERFAVPPDKMYHHWPEEVLPTLQLDEECYAVLLTHDPKIDDPALHYFLGSRVSYIGALGSKKTHARRCERLREAGFDQATIARIHGPAGLDISAKTPEEIALSIMAQVVSQRRGRQV